jgi:hypothetical protein
LLILTIKIVYKKYTFILTAISPHIFKKSIDSNK